MVVVWLYALVATPWGFCLVMGVEWMVVAPTSWVSPRDLFLSNVRIFVCCMCIINYYNDKIESLENVIEMLK